MSWRGLVLLVGLTLLGDSGPWAQADERSDDFERNVWPILAANCLVCHGEQKQESELRLDSRDALLRGGANGPAAQPGNPGQSALIQAIHWDGELKMPPEKKLREEEIATLTRWVARGLPWPQTSVPKGENWRLHWAFQALRHPLPPPSASAIGARTPLDLFHVAELERAGLAPGPEAAPRTLIRRASFDLLGLPPTPDEVDAFLQDPSPDAWERLLAKLLASPQYGERWGRHWLDVARYADTKGYVFFEEKKYPWAYTYRDYVVRSLNSDLPYDRFVLEQLAADQLDLGSDRRPLTALGFLTVGAHFMNNTHDILDDRIDVVSRGLLGLTVSCARCHDHKYDPISAADYYGLYGIFRSCYEPTVPPMFEPPPESEEYRKFATEMASREKKLVDFVTQKHSELVRESRTRVAEYLLAAYNLRDQPPTDDFMLLVEKGDLNPTMILRWQVYLNERRTNPDPVWTAWHALSELPPESFANQSAAALDRIRSSGTEVSPANQRVMESLRQDPLTSMRDVAERYGELLKSIDRQWQDQLKGATTAKQPRPQRLEDSVAEELRQVLYGEGTPPQVPLAMDWGFLSLFPDRPTQGEYQKLLKEVEQWMMTGAGAPPRAMVLLDSQQPFEPRVFLRGNPHRLGEPARRQFLSALSGTEPPFVHGSGRLELARAIANPNNPLTARVIVNRIWQHHFGHGLVRTPSDFGLRSEPPSHPELLDWLASELIAHHWSLKWLHWEIMRSSVYRQASETPFADQGKLTDPENRLLWRFPRQRLDFEAQRDTMLAVANSLDRRIGGPPLDLLGEAVTPRRTIYGLLDRMDVPALLTTFDFPDPLSTSAQRNETTVAPQSLYTMNNGFVTEIARRLATRPDVAGQTDPAERVRHQFRLCFSREPTDEELAAALEFIATNSPDEKSWQRFAQALLLANEFLFIE